MWCENVNTVYHMESFLQQAFLEKMCGTELELSALCMCMHYHTNIFIYLAFIWCVYMICHTD